MNRIRELQRQYSDIEKEIAASTEVLSLSRTYDAVKVPFDTTAVENDSVFYNEIKTYLDTSIIAAIIIFDSSELVKLNNAVIKSIEKLNKASNRTYLKIDSINLSQKNNPVIYTSRLPTYLEKARQIFNDICRDPLSLLGIFVTALALSLGAQFWFDLLKKLVALRGSGAKPDEAASSMSATSPKKVENDGNRVMSDNPFEIAISEHPA